MEQILSDDEKKLTNNIKILLDKIEKTDGKINRIKIAYELFQLFWTDNYLSFANKNLKFKEAILFKIPEFIFNINITIKNDNLDNDELIICNKTIDMLNKLLYLLNNTYSKNDLIDVYIKSTNTCTKIQI